MTREKSTRNPSHVAISCLFGLGVIASGLWRYVSAEGGHAGLWFGLVMGGLALLASWLFWKQQVWPASILLWICLMFVGGWFCYETFVKKGLANAEPRQLIIIGLTILTALVWIWTMRSAKRHGGDPDDTQVKPGPA